MLSRRAARTHLVASRRPKYFLRLRNAGSASPGSGRPVRRDSATARRFASNPSDPTSRWAPCPAQSHRWNTLLPSSSCARRGITPAFGYGPRLGSVRLDFHQLATRAARRALRPLLTSPRRAAASRPPPSHPGTPAKTSPDKSSNRRRTPAASTQRPLDDHGLRRPLPTRPDRPAFYAVRVPRVATSSRASFPPHLTMTQLPPTCGWGHLLHGGLTPPSCCPCRAYNRVGAGLTPAPPTPPDMRVRIRRFASRPGGGGRDR